MSEVDPWVQKYVSELDGIVNWRAALAKSDINRIFEAADNALIKLGRKHAPGHPFMPLQAKVSERYSRTKAALDSFYDTGETSEWHGEGYRIMPGELGPIPENLERGTVYTLTGFATTELVCTSLFGASAWCYDDGAYSFTRRAEYDLEYLEGDHFRYDGEFVRDCEDCRSCTTYDSFTRLHPDGSEVLDEYYIPKQYAALRGMVVAVEVQDQEPKVAA